MGRILISNDAVYADRLNEMYIEGGFGKYHFTEFGDEKIYIYKKILVDNDNYLEIDNDSFISCVGTFIYNGKMGKEALSEFWFAYQENGIDVRKEALGCFAICIKNLEGITLFTDYDGKYALYYYIGNDGKYIITCRYAHIEMLLNLPINKFAVIEQGIQFCILGKDTLYEGVYRLQGYEEMTIQRGKIVVKDLAENWCGQNTNCEKIDIYSLCNNIKEIQRQYDDNFAKQIICMTGGLDSRLALAGMLTGKSEKGLLTWQGAGRMFNSCKQDQKICMEIAKKLGIKFKTPFLDEHYNLENDTDKFMLRLGELYQIYGGNKEFHKLIADETLPEYVTFGYFGEPYRTNDDLDLVYHDNFTIEDYFNKFYLAKQYEKCVEEWNEYKEYLFSKVKNIAVRMKLNLKSLSKDDCAKLHFYYRAYADNKCCLLMNDYRYSTQILAEHDVIRNNYCISYDEKRNAAFQIRCISELYPELIQFPLFSHCAFRSVDKDTLQILEPSRINVIKVKTEIDKFGKKYFGKFYYKIWDIYCLVAHPNNLSKDNFKIMNYYEDYIKNKSQASVKNIFKLSKTEWDECIAWEYFIGVLSNYVRYRVN